MSAEASAAFSDDYRSARERFVAAAQAADWQRESYTLSGCTGPAGESLSIDVAINASGDNERCLVVSSGLHGVEAFLGSALQLTLMQRWHGQATALPRIVLIHILNPYGCAWLRRADQDNIDLNRNFLLDGEVYRGAPAGYAALDTLLNPRTPPARYDAFTLRALGQIARHGLPALRSAIVAGQYDFPRGLFFGGAHASQTQRIVAANLAQWLGAARSVLHLDIHSGLGAWGNYKLLIDQTLNAAQRARLRAGFGERTFEESGARSVGYATRGGFGPWCIAHHTERDYLFAYAEFGAYNLLRTLAGLRAENQAHFWGAAQDANTLRAKAWLKELLCPASIAWREQVLARGVDLVERARALLARA